MSDKFPMIAVDKVEVKLTMPVQTTVAVDKVCSATGMSRVALINAYVDDGLQKADVQLDAEDLKRVEEIIMRNIEKREAKKAQKGMK